MLESRPPDRKLETGTSATRWAVTDSSITARRSAGSPGGGLGRDVGDLPVRLHVGGTVRAEARAKQPPGSLRTWSIEHRWSGSQ